MTRYLPHAALAGLLAGFVGFAAWLFARQAEAGRGLPPFSVYSDERDGLAESAHLLQQLGWTPVALTRPAQHPRVRGLLILAEPQGRGLFARHDALADAETEVLLRWVGQGNTLLLACRRETGVHRKLGVAVVGKPDGDEGLVVPDEMPEVGYTDGTGRFTVDGRVALRADAGVPLWTVGSDPGALAVRHGQGRVLFLADPTLLTRRGLGRDDNVLFLVNVADRHAHRGVVYYDEYHHGFRSAGGFWGYLGHHGQRLALLPVFALVLAWAWSRAVRLGPAVPTPRVTETDAVDYASALARLYQKAGARGALARALARGFVQAVHRLLRVRPRALPAEVLAAYHPPAGGPGRDELKRLLLGVSGIRNHPVNDRQLLAWARSMDGFLAALRAGAGDPKRPGAR